MYQWMGVLLPQGHDLETGRVVARRRLAGVVRRVAAVALVGLVAAACGTSSSSPAGATGTPLPIAPAPVTPAPVTPAPATPAPTDTPAPISQVTGVPTSLDPCQLVTSQEASQFAGASYGAGVESTTSGGGKICTYGGQTLNVFMVIVGQAPDVATAQAGKAEAEAAIQQQAGKAIPFIELPTFADGAAYVSGTITVSGQSFSAGAIYALKGTIFFGFSDVALGKAAPTLAALQAQAQTILGRLP